MTYYTGIDREIIDELLSGKYGSLLRPRAIYLAHSIEVVKVADRGFYECLLRLRGGVALCFDTYYDDKRFVEWLKENRPEIFI